MSILAGAFNSVKIPGYPPVAIPPAAAAPTVNASLPTGVPLKRRQAIGATNVVPSTSTPVAGVGGLPLVGGVVSGVTGSSGPLGAVGGAVGTVANTAGSGKSILPFCVLLFGSRVHNVETNMRPALGDLSVSS